MLSRLQVTNLPPTMSKAELKQLFESHGQVSAVSLVAHAKPLGAAQVIMKHLDDATACVAGLDGTEVEGHAVRVQLCRTRIVAPVPRLGGQGCAVGEVAVKRKH